MFAVYLGVFASAFLAATFVPIASEVAVLGAASHSQVNLTILWLVATAGNTLGSIINWALGGYSSRFQDRRWWPVSATQMQRAGEAFNRYGIWTLLLAWLPIVGDPLTIIAGVLRVRLCWFVLLVGIGKAARFAVVIGLFAGFG